VLEISCFLERRANGGFPDETNLEVSQLHRGIRPNSIPIFGGCYFLCVLGRLRARAIVTLCYTTNIREHSRCRWFRIVFFNRARIYLFQYVMQTGETGTFIIRGDRGERFIARRKSRRLIVARKPAEARGAKNFGLKWKKPPGVWRTN